MPNVEPGESREHYVQRCVPYVVNGEGLTSHAALGKCEGMYDEHLKRQKQRAAKGAKKEK